MATHATGAYRRRTGTTRDATDVNRRARLFATIVGATFLLVGIAGFIPGVTQNLGDIKFAGHESGAELLGIFRVSVLHNLVHVLFGVAGLAAARRARAARAFLLIGGIAYLALWLLGLATHYESDANFVPVNNADDWLHFALGGGMIALWLLSLRPNERGGGSRIPR
jgi:hypothetical protein